MIRIVTIDREYGSGGSNIARKVSERLGWKLWDQLLTNEIARLMECDCQVVEQHEEKRDPFYYRLLKSFMQGSFEGSLHVPGGGRMADTDCIREIAERVVKSAAEGGHCVIVGRGSAYYLQNRTDAFHAFVYAPVADKIRRLQAEGKTEAEALELAATVDRDRAAFIKEYFRVEWPDRHKFHVMINSAVSEDAAAETIWNALKAYDQQRASRVSIAG